MPLDPIKPLPKRPRLDSEAYLGQQRCSLTLTTHNHALVFTNSDIFQLMCSVLWDTATKNAFRVWVFCFMPDHLHLLIEGKEDFSDIQKFVKDFKQKSGYEYKQLTNKKLWGTSYFDHMLRNEEDTIVVVRYILENPVRAGLVKSWWEYPYSGSFEMDIQDLL